MRSAANSPRPSNPWAPARLAGNCLAIAAALLTHALAGAAIPGLEEKPLAPISGPRGATMFTEMPASRTGIVVENSYSDPRMWGELGHEFEVGAIGTGIAIGDYDGDGRPDIFVVSKTESCRLFRNLGDFRFEDVTERAGVGDTGAAAGTWKQGATFVDINNDGLLDLYVCRFNAPNLLYINQGDGTFKEQAHQYGLDVTDASAMAAFCDYDRDGWLDVFIQTNLLDNNAHPAGQRNYLFHNNRNGTFTDVSRQAGITGEAQGHSATWWDFDNDGWPDLYVANDFSAPDKLYHNNRDGTFTDVINQVVPHMPFSSMGSDLGDVNNDGLIDFLATDMAGSTHERDERGMAESRSRTREESGHPRLSPQYEHNALYLNTGTGRCLEAAHLAGLGATDWTWAVRFEDFDNDGRLDLFVTNGMHREANNTDLLARQMSAETAEQRGRVIHDSPVFAENHFAFRNLGDLAFENVSAAWGLNQRAVSFGAATGDLDGDGDLDLVFANYQGGVTVLRNDCDTGNRVTLKLRGTTSNRFGVGATVRIESASGPQVRQLVLARGVLSSSEPIVHFGLGKDDVIKRMTVSWPSGIEQVFTDVPVNRQLNIVEAPGPVKMKTPPVLRPQFTEHSAEFGLSLLSSEEELDETATQRLLPRRLNRRGPAAAVTRFADGATLIAVGGTTVVPRQVLLGDSTGHFRAANSPDLGSTGPADDGPLLFFDSKGDGGTDLLVTKGGSALPADSPEYQPKLFLGDGRGGFTPAPADALPSLSICAGAVVAADFDHTGRLGFFIGGRARPGEYPLSPRSALLANRGGKFEDVTDALAPGLREVGMVTSALWSDVDGDGWADLLVTLEWGQVKYFHNNQGAGFEDWSAKAGFVAAGSGWWTSIAAADFNGDGRMDYVVGNVGLNTQYQASAERPALLFYGDFTGRGEEPQIVEATYEGEKLYPWRSRKDLGAVIPSILRRFPRNNGFAQASLAEVVGPDRLAKAQRFEATEFRSGVFLSQADGTYRFEPLPRVAQISPFQGIAAGDFDGSGHAGIYAVQNSFAPIPLVGRFDGGLSQLLKGDGMGHFTAVPAAESGLIVPGDAKAVVVLDLTGNGRPDFFVTRNNDSTLLFKNELAAGMNTLRISLRGPTGNPVAVGARVLVARTSGAMESGEVFAGSSNFSQSTSDLFFGYPDSDPPKSVRVRWPSGDSSEFAATRERTMTLSEPAR